MKPTDIICDDAHLAAQDFVVKNIEMFSHAQWLCTLKIAQLLRSFAKIEEDKIIASLNNFTITPK